MAINSQLVGFLFFKSLSLQLNLIYSFLAVLVLVAAFGLPLVAGSGGTLVAAPVLLFVVASLAAAPRL